MKDTQLESGLASHLTQELGMNTPTDFENPNWEEFESTFKHIHDWKSYVSDELKKHWCNIDEKSKAIFASCLQDIADREHWE